MARLPVPGSDDGEWGEVLNEFLEVGHHTDGTNIGGIVEVSKSSGYTLTAAENGKRIICTASLTLTVPAVGTLGTGFECEIINDSGGTVTLDGPGGTNVSIADGEIACVIEANSKQFVVKGTSTVIS